MTEQGEARAAAADETFPEISVVIPVYRSSGMLETLYARLESALDKLGDPWEIVFVEDASPDDSWRVLEGLAARDLRVRAIRLMCNYGQQRAVLAGLAHARGNFVVTIASVQSTVGYPWIARSIPSCVSSSRLSVAKWASRMTCQGKDIPVPVRSVGSPNRAIPTGRTRFRKYH